MLNRVKKLLNIKDNERKTMIIASVAMLFTIISVIGITYAAFRYTKEGTKSNKVTTSTITMNYNEATNGITLTNAFPMSDNDGKVLTGEGNTFGFTVTVTTGNNTPVGYEISAVKDPNSTLGNNDVRIYLEKSTTGAEGTYSSVLEPTGFSPINATTEIGTPQGEMLLHSDSTTSTRTDYYILRMWIRSDYEITGESKFFTIKVNVYGTDSHINTSGISLNKNSMTLHEGESEQLSATVLPDYATDKSVTWESSNTDVAVVNSSGNVTAQSIPGITATATITAIDSKGHSATCTVTVNKPEPTGVEIEDNITELNLIAPGETSGGTTEGSSTILEAGTTPANANSNEVEWTTSDSDVLDIEKYTEANASGTGSSKSVVANKVKVTAKGAGSATLTVKSASNPSAPSKSITVTIEDPESTGLTIDKPNVTIDRNSSTTITATLNLSNSRDKTIYWTNSDATIASINCTGGSTNSSGEIVTSNASAVCTVTGLVAGSTIITARDAKGHTATSVVTVQNELATSISLSSDAEIEVGASHIFQASVTPSDARDISSITWTSSNTSVATIPQECTGSTTCEIEGLDEGTTNITVTIGNLSDTSQLDVVPGNIGSQLKNNMTLLSSTSSDTNPIYYYNGNASTTNNNVSFGGYCWKIIRTTDTGGIKMIYNGTPTNGECTTTTGANTQIGTSIYNDTYNSTAYDSTAKTEVDNWYNNNLSSYSSYLQNTSYCGDTLDTSNPLSCSTSYTLNRGLISPAEAYLAGLDTTNTNTSNYLYTGEQYWTMSTGNGTSSQSISFTKESNNMRGTYTGTGTSSNILTTNTSGTIVDSNNGTYYGTGNILSCYSRYYSNNYSSSNPTGGPVGADVSTSCCTMSTSSKNSSCGRGVLGDGANGGGLSGSYDHSSSGSSLGLRPVISISSSVKLGVGNGSSSSPYTLQLGS